MSGRVLDLGCGSGTWAQRLGVPPRGLKLIGVDLSLEACRLAAQRGPDPRWLCVCACGERLPLADDSFDNAICNVALPYTNIPAALQETYRVLRPGGSFDVSLHPFSFLLREFRRRPLLSLHFLYLLYVAANGFWFHLTGKVWKYPYSARFESWQSRRGMGIALRRAGFMSIRYTSLPGGRFVVQAVRPASKLRAVPAAT